MADTPTGRCRGRTCRAQLLWLPTQTGRAIPLDAKPDPEGNVVIEGDLLGEPYAQVLNDGDATRVRSQGEKTLYMPHFYSCPDVEEFRDA